MKNNVMKKCLRISAVLSLFLFCTFVFSGCGHYSRREAAEWFQANVIDEGILVSKEYTERESSNGGTDRVWTAHLKDLPEVEFELISHRSISLFISYDMETTYYLEMGRFYLENYKDKNPSALSGLDINTTDQNHLLTVRGIYDTKEEIETICSQMENLENYTAAQDYPCQIRYELAYYEPLTFLPGNTEDTFTSRDTYIFEDGGGSAPGAPGAESLAESLCYKANRSFAEYAAAYRLETEQFSEEQLSQAVNARGDYRFTITRPDGMQICYPELILRYSDSMSIGCLYEVLIREGTYQVSGIPEEFTFTAADGSTCSFSYSYRVRLGSTDVSSNDALLPESFYYLSNGSKVILSEDPLINGELFLTLTGLTFDTINS